jgi:Bacterial PH domain
VTDYDDDLIAEADEDVAGTWPGKDALAVPVGPPVGVSSAQAEGSEDDEPEPGEDPMAWVPGDVARWLLQFEEPLVCTRQHWIRLVPAYVAWGVLIPAIWTLDVYLYWTSSVPLVLYRVFWAATVICGLYGVWRWQHWRHWWLVVTKRRAFNVSGVFTRQLQQLPVSRIRDADPTESLFGRWLGYGTLEFSSIATGHSLQFVPYVPGVVTVHREITRLTARPAGL